VVGAWVIYLKQLAVYVVNGSTGYQINGGTDDEKDFDTYLPTIEKMLDTFRLFEPRKSIQEDN